MSIDIEQAQQILRSRYESADFVTESQSTPVVDAIAQVAVIAMVWKSDAFDDGNYCSRDHWHAVDLTNGNILMTGGGDHVWTRTESWQAMNDAARYWKRRLSDENSDFASDDYIEGITGSAGPY